MKRPALLYSLGYAPKSDTSSTSWPFGLPARIEQTRLLMWPTS